MVNIYVGNLPYGTTDQELQDLFSQFGAISKVSIITDRETGRSKGFGFVEMADEAEGRQAIEALNGQQFGGRALTVNEARPRSNDRGGGGYGGGGGGGGGYRGNR
ncbi:MAG: RNA-binding protein [Planctomycetota bacterium]|nr:RNA-binding protein [Planctomycetota bacterium]